MIWVDWVVLMIGCSILTFTIGINIRRKDDEDMIENLKRSRDFHKDHNETLVYEAREIVKENHSLRKMNDQLIQENKELKKELDKQSNTTYNYFIGCDVPNSEEATPPLQKK